MNMVLYVPIRLRFELQQFVADNLVWTRMGNCFQGPRPEACNAI